VLTRKDRPQSYKWLFSRTYLLPTLIKIGSPRFRRFVVDVLPWKSLHELRDLSDVLYETSMEILESKKAALKAGDEAIKQQVGEGKDILSILSACLVQTRLPTR